MPSISSPVRVMHLVPMLRTGGMEHGVVKVVNGLQANGIESAIASLHPADSLRDLVNEHIPVFEYTKREGNDPIVVAKLARLLRRWRPDVVHTHSWGTLCEGWLAARIARVPYAVHGEHGTLEDRGRNVAVQRWFWNHVDRVLAVSDQLANRMAAAIGFPRERIVTIRNGVDLSRFTPRFDAGTSEREPSGSNVTIGTIGRLVTVKDQDALLRAVSLLIQRAIPVRGVIVGEGPLRGDLERTRAALGLEGRVQLPGFRADVEHVLPAFDVFVLPSRSEGMSNTILEAMAAGVPVVATRVGGATDMIEDGVSGLLVPPADPEALAAAIERLARDASLRSRLAAAGRRRAVEGFGLDRMLDEYGRMYRDLTQAPAGAQVSSATAN